MSTFDVKVELTNGVKDTFTLRAKTKEEAEKIAKNRVEIILGTNKMDCKLKTIEVSEWFVE